MNEVIERALELIERAKPRDGYFEVSRRDLFALGEAVEKELHP